jgi:uncharacterized membrane protein YqjE
VADYIYKDTKSVQHVLNDMKDELRDFISTRFELLRAEMIDKWNSIKAAAPMLAAGLALLLAAFGAFTFGLIALVAALIGGEYRWALGAAAVTVLYGIIGGAMAWMSAKQLTADGMAPERTLRVLKQDQMWAKNEARAS